LGIEKKDIPIELEEKILKFASTKETFTTKDLFEKYPNNPEFVLRYALNNLRIENRIQMIGNKKGAYYTSNMNLKEEVEVSETFNTSNSDLKQRILDLSEKFPGWWARTELGIDDVSVPNILSSVKELIEEKKVESQGSLRWTKYRLVGKGDSESEEVKENKNDTPSNNYSDILDFIKKRKVVTIPMIIEELELSRSDIIDVLNKLCNEEEIYHEGVRKSSKYIYKTVSCSEVESIMEELSKERRVEERIDELSNFLISDEATAISVGLDRNDIFQIKFMKNGTINQLKKFENIKDGISFIYGLTNVKNG
jgi:predicted transcriptional regulator